MILKGAAGCFIRYKLPINPRFVYIWYNINKENSKEVLMDKNKKLIYCIIGSITLALLNNEIFTPSKFGIFHGGTFIGQIIFWVSSILSLVGLILMIIFSILLIANNIDIRHKK